MNAVGTKQHLRVHCPIYMRAPQISTVFAMLFCVRLWSSYGIVRPLNALPWQLYSDSIVLLLRTPSDIICLVHAQSASRGLTFNAFPLHLVAMPWGLPGRSAFFIKATWMPWECGPRVRTRFVNKSLEGWWKMHKYVNISSMQKTHLGLINFHFISI